MTMRSTLAIVAGMVLAFAAFLPSARADEWNQMTEFTFNQPVEIPGRVLPAGTYWFVLADSQADRNIVQVFSHDWSKQYANLLTASTDRPEPTGRTEVKFAERRHDQPQALLKWYYPGRVIGHEFLYSKRHEREFATDAKRDVEARPFAGRG
jgi:hypothetical protein